MRFLRFPDTCRFSFRIITDGDERGSKIDAQLRKRLSLSVLSWSKRGAYMRAPKRVLQIGFLKLFLSEMSPRAFLAAKAKFSSNSRQQVAILPVSAETGRSQTQGAILEQVRQR